MYEQENAKIESDINTIVRNYMAYESNTVLEISNNASPTVLLTLYPELKSSTLVTKQINIYTENNQKIKQLKEKSIDYKRQKKIFIFI